MGTKRLLLNSCTTKEGELGYAKNSVENERFYKALFIVKISLSPPEVVFLKVCCFNKVGITR